MTLGEVVQAAAAFAMVQGAFNWITDSYGRLAEWTSSANRVASLLLALERRDQRQDRQRRAGLAAEALPDRMQQAPGAQQPRHHQHSAEDVDRDL